jgi:hypothetical protein
MGNAFLNSITHGEKLRLRDDVLPLVKRREWVFAGMGKSETILLAHEWIGYIWAAKPDGIDWEEYRRRKKLD